jgi:hypothetical protein
MKPADGLLTSLEPVAPKTLSSGGNWRFQSGRDDIEEEASMLLGSTIELSTLEHKLQMPYSKFTVSESALQTPRFTFHGDGVWLVREPLMGMASSNKLINFRNASEPIARSESNEDHSTKRSAPSIPRKSSRRMSIPPRSALVNSKPSIEQRQGTKPTIQNPNGNQKMTSTKGRSPKVFRGNILSPEYLVIPNADQSRMNTVNNINNSIANMQKFSAELKPPVKKRRLMNNNILSNMKIALSDRLQVQDVKKKGQVKVHNLLHVSNSEGKNSDGCTPGNKLSPIERRINEG